MGNGAASMSAQVDVTQFVVQAPKSYVSATIETMRNQTDALSAHALSITAVCARVGLYNMEYSLFILFTLSQCRFAATLRFDSHLRLNQCQ